MHGEYPRRRTGGGGFPALLGLDVFERWKFRVSIVFFDDAKLDRRDPNACGSGERQEEYDYNPVHSPEFNRLRERHVSNLVFADQQIGNRELMFGQRVAFRQHCQRTIQLQQFPDANCDDDSDHNLC